MASARLLQIRRRGQQRRRVATAGGARPPCPARGCPVSRAQRPANRAPRATRTPCPERHRATRHAPRAPRPERRQAPRPAPRAPRALRDQRDAASRAPHPVPRATRHPAPRAPRASCCPRALPLGPHPTRRRAPISCCIQIRSQNWCHTNHMHARSHARTATRGPGPCAAARAGSSGCKSREGGAARHRPNPRWKGGGSEAAARG